MTDDGFWLLILCKGQAFVPTMARTEAGFYIGIEPVEVVDARDHVGMEQALIRTIRRGNPAVPTPSRANSSKNLLLKYAKVKSTTSFEKLARSWKFSKSDGAYLIIPYKRRKDGGEEEDQERGEGIPAEEPLELVVRRLVSRALESDE
jgi:hypothetical protein